MFFVVVIVFVIRVICLGVELKMSLMMCGLRCMLLVIVFRMI